MGREGPGTAVTALDETLPVLTKALVITRHPLAQHFADGARERGRLEEIESNSQKKGASGSAPERIHARGIWVEHLRDTLQIIQAPRRIARDVGERVPARGAAVFGERIEQIARLAAAGPKACGDHPVLALHVQAHQGSWPVERIGNHDTGALSGPRRRRQCHALLTREHEQAPPSPSQDDAFGTEKTCGRDLGATGEARIPVQGTPARQEHHTETHKNNQHCSSARDPEAMTDVGAIPVVIPVLAQGEGRRPPRIGVHRPEEERTGERAAEDERGGARECRLDPAPRGRLSSARPGRGAGARAHTRSP